MGMTVRSSTPLQQAIAAAQAGLSAQEFVRQGFARAPEPGTKRLRPIRLIPVQQKFLEGFDERDPATGLPRFSELLFSSIKKTGKDTALAICGSSH